MSIQNRVYHVYKKLKQELKKILHENIHNKSIRVNVVCRLKYYVS